MSETEQEIESVEYQLAGDHDSCGACQETEKSIKNITSDKIAYTYFALDSPEAKKILEQKGIKEDEHFDIPVVKACATKIDKEGHKSKKCGWVQEPTKVNWKDLDNKLLPDTVSLDLDE
jgi:hypothetical protein